MGCVISRQAVTSEKKGSGGESNRKVDEVENGCEKEKIGGGDRVQQCRGESRRSKANPRLSNPPKHLLGEQVAAGWPPWLTAVCGEALSGWIPRKADSFEKIDKVCFCFVIIASSLVTLMDHDLFGM